MSFCPLQSLMPLQMRFKETLRNGAAIWKLIFNCLCAQTQNRDRISQIKGEVCGTCFKVIAKKLHDLAWPHESTGMVELLREGSP